jgi:hypothetical protein
MSDANPSLLTASQLVERLLHDVLDEQRSEAAIARALKASEKWPDRYLTLDSWFAVGADVDAIMAEKKTRKARAGAVIDSILPKGRESWARRLAWTALVANAADDEDWIDFALVAQELVGDRPLRQIPLAAWVAENTVEAAAGR